MAGAQGHPYLLCGPAVVLFYQQCKDGHTFQVLQVSQGAHGHQNCGWIQPFFGESGDWIGPPDSKYEEDQGLVAVAGH